MGAYLFYILCVDALLLNHLTKCNYRANFISMETIFFWPNVICLTECEIIYHLGRNASNSYTTHIRNTQITIPDYNFFIHRLPKIPKIQNNAQVAKTKSPLFDFFSGERNSMFHVP